MSVDRHYRCDLCGGSGQLDEELVGLYWRSNGPAMEVRPARSVEHHICTNCAGEIARLVQCLQIEIAKEATP